MLPRLERANYPKGFSAALISNAAPLGLLIPPSSIQIIYAWGHAPIRAEMLSGDSRCRPSSWSSCCAW